MEAALLKLSAGESDVELINTIFRVAHSIKGGSATFGFTDVASFTHKLETLLDELRAGKRRANPGMVDTLLRSCDLMREMLSAHPGEADRSTRRASPRCRPRSSRSSRRPATQPRRRAAAPRPAPRRPHAARRTCAAAGASISFPVPNYCATATIRCACCASWPRSAPCEVRVDAKWVPLLAELDPEECRLSWRIELHRCGTGGRDPRGVRLGRRRVRSETRGLRPGGGFRRNTAGARQRSSRYPGGCPRARGAAAGA